MMENAKRVPMSIQLKRVNKKLKKMPTKEFLDLVVRAGIITEAQAAEALKKKTAAEPAAISE